jgi:glutaredoxin
MHTKGQGCPKCKTDKSKLTRDEFITKSIEVHGNKYTYDNVVMGKSTKDKVSITCPVHGDFQQDPFTHLRNHGCPKCKVDKQTLTQDEFIQRSENIHNGFYTYGNVNYVNNNTPVMITCPVHGDFPQRPSSHLTGAGCKKCFTDKTKVTRDEFIDRSTKIFNGFYKYDNVVMGNSVDDKVSITCPKHGDFSIKAFSHLQGQGCSKCAESKGEKTLTNYFTENKIKFKPQEKFKGCFSIGVKSKKCFLLPFDFYLLDTNILVEVDGLQHFNSVTLYGDDSFNKTITNDILKNEFVRKNDKISKLIRLYYNGRNFNYLISELDRLLNTESSEKILLSKDYPKAGWNK